MMKSRLHSIIQRIVRRKDRSEETAVQNFSFYIEEFNYFHDTLYIKGWAFSLHGRISQIGFVDSNGVYRFVRYNLLASEDIVNIYGQRAAGSRFSIMLTENLPEDLLDLCLVFKVKHSYVVRGELWKFGIDRDIHRQELPRFFRSIAERDKKTVILEIGSRARSGVNQKARYIPEHAEYVGIDIMEGPGVDIVVDAHNLSAKVKHNYFDYVFSLNTFEHLLMPWKVVLEINRVLKLNGIVMIFTHHTFPLHDTPSDFWRFSDTAWHGLFNQYSGFEIIETTLGDPVSIVPKSMYAGTIGTADAPAYIHSMVTAKKIADTALSWDVPVSNVLDAMYPE